MHYRYANTSALAHRWGHSRVGASWRLFSVAGTRGRVCSVAGAHGRWYSVGGGGL